MGKPNLQTGNARRGKSAANQANKPATASLKLVHSARTAPDGGGMTREPNATTVKALQDDMHNRRNAKTFNSVAALMKDLDE